MKCSNMYFLDRVSDLFVYGGIGVFSCSVLKRLYHIVYQSTLIMLHSKTLHYSAHYSIPPLTHIQTSSTRADPESQRGFNNDNVFFFVCLLLFFPNTTLSGPLSARRRNEIYMAFRAFRWLVDVGQTLNAGSVAL